MAKPGNVVEAAQLCELSFHNCPVPNAGRVFLLDLSANAPLKG
jgi:hypothetical protein